MKLWPKHLSDTLRQAVPVRLRTRAARKWGLVLLVVIVVYGVVGFLLAPALIRHYGIPILSKSLLRPVSIGSISLNPFTLRFEADQVQVHKLQSTGQETGQGTGDFVTFNKLVVRLSWSSLFRLKPIVDEVWLDAPNVNITRTAARQFNFSDLVQRYSKPAKPGGKPARFSVSNIHIDNGSINFDDRVLNKQHHIKHLRIGIPFIANLPSTTDIFVKPLLQARIDGSPLLIIGNTKPYSSNRESDVTLKLNHLNLPQLMSYVPAALPIDLPQGQLSSNLNLQFSIVDGTPRILISGSVDLDHIAITDTAGKPLFDAKRIRVVATSVEPLKRVFHLSKIQIDQPSVFVSRSSNGKLNLSALAGATKTKSAHSSASSSPQSASKTASSVTTTKPMDFKLHQLDLTAGTIHFRDDKTSTPVQLDLGALNVKMMDFNTLGHTPARYSMHTTLLQHDVARGSLSGTGSLIYAKHELASDIIVKGLMLPTFQPYLDAMLAGRIDQGNLDAHSHLSIDWAAPKPDLQASAAGLKLSGLRVSASDDTQPLIKLKQADVEIKQVDLSAKRIEIPSINLQELATTVQRDRNGSINLLALLKPGKSAPSQAAQPATKTPAVASSAPAWRYHIGSFTLNGSTLDFTDQTHSQPVSLQISKLQFNLRNISQDTHQAWPFDLSGTLQDKGSIALNGTIALAPLALKLQLKSRNIDVTTFQPYFGQKINASISSALLDVNGDARLAQAGSGWKVNYDGSVGLDSVRMLDKKTSDLFAGWGKLELSHIKMAYDAKGTDVSIGRIALERFFARIFLDSQGNLNLNRFMAGTNTTPSSLTRVEQGKAAPAQTPRKTAATKASAMNLSFDEIDLSNGNIDYTDDFIKPNYSAKLTAIQGRVGAFGTGSKQSAPVDLQANLSTGGSVKINGTVNPLSHPPFLNMTAHASNIELPQFASYSSKYTGYPIEKGKLNVDLNYHLDSGALTAKNHLFIDQLTFGDHVESPTATNLPVRLAVSLLKNSQGQINLNIPVSGSLSDPKFSIGGLIWQALTGLIRKAITAPFALLTGAFGGSEKLSYIEFAPGSAMLSAQATGKLKILEKALSDRPAIELDISGLADPAKDRPALRAMQVARQVKAEKIKALREDGKNIEAASVEVSASEYDKYLKLAYEDADFKKPRNFIGWAKSLPPAQMKQLMLDNAKVGDDDLHALAQQRAAAVRMWFKGKIDDKRLYVVAPKVQATKSDNAGPRVEFSLKR